MAAVADVHFRGGRVELAEIVEAVDDRALEGDHQWVPALLRVKGSIPVAVELDRVPFGEVEPIYHILGPNRIEAEMVGLSVAKITDRRRGRRRRRRGGGGGGGGGEVGPEPGRSPGMVPRGTMWLFATVQSEGVPVLTGNQLPPLASGALWV